MSAEREIYTGILAWIPVTQALPDDDETVLIYSPDQSDPVWLGFLDAGVWRNVDATEAGDVTHWLPMPRGPVGMTVTEAIAA